jgi:Bax protein
MKHSSEPSFSDQNSSLLPEMAVPGNRRSFFKQAGLFVMLVGLGVLSGFVFLALPALRTGREVVMVPILSEVNVTSSDELISLLKEKGLWEITGNFAVPRLILSSYPANIGNLDPEVKKKAFLNSLLPAALMAMGEVEKERETLRAILVKIPRSNQNLLISEPLDGWAGSLSNQEIDDLMVLGLKYRTDETEELVKRIDLVPLSLLLAQAALESSWGSSRIARDGNNLFGVVTWGDNAVEPPVNGDGSGRRYANYDSILDSVRAYIVMLNRLPSYQHFREIRSRTRNPLKLAEGLKNYSERRGGYIADLKEVMVGNDLNRYDGCVLALPPAPPPRSKGLWWEIAREFNLTPQKATAI